MHSPANATNARPVITLIPAFLFVLRTRRSEVRILSSAPFLSLQALQAFETSTQTYSDSDGGRQCSIQTLDTHFVSAECFILVSKFLLISGNTIRSLESLCVFEPPPYLKPSGHQKLF